MDDARFVNNRVFVLRANQLTHVPQHTVSLGARFIWKKKKKKTLVGSEFAENTTSTIFVRIARIFRSNLAAETHQDFGLEENRGKNNVFLDFNTFCCEIVCNLWNLCWGSFPRMNFEKSCKKGFSRDYRLKRFDSIDLSLPRSLKRKALTEMLFETICRRYTVRNAGRS